METKIATNGSIADVKPKHKLSPWRRRLLEEELALAYAVHTEIAQAVADGDEWAERHLDEFARIIRELEEELGDVD